MLTTFIQVLSSLKICLDGHHSYVLSHHNVVRKVAQYWKTPFYNLLNVSIVNASVLYNLTAVQVGLKAVSENEFRDQLVLQ